ncbi:sensor histidine kinase [Nocardia brasiliensis]|uniref:sensor histidine kinase n=1 Tax=Nocardia brasiliensis TaxID=37326 RepID=UPI00245409E1|nr:histidine kinase [Nocardia brasiliensis]
MRPIDRAKAVVVQVRRRIWNLGVGVGDTGPGGMYVLLIALALPLWEASTWPVGRLAASGGAVAGFGVLFVWSQSDMAGRPMGFRVGLLAAMAAVAGAGTAAFGTSWVVALMLTAVACVNLLPLVFGSVLGVLAVGSLTWAVLGQGGAALVVFGAGMIAVLRGRLLLEIVQSRATRQAMAAAAVGDERLRIARDLHDLLGNSLATMLVKAELAQRLAHIDPDAAAAASAEVQQVGRQTMLEVQEAVRGYRATTLADEVARAKQSLALLRDGLTVRIPDRVWDERVDTLLGWVVREAVTNVLRHADASRCAITVRVHEQPRAVELTVDNDELFGRASTGGGHGLLGLAERARVLGGTVTAGPTANGGYRLAVSVPLPATRPAESSA